MRPGVARCGSRRPAPRGTRAGNASAPSQSAEGRQGESNEDDSRKNPLCSIQGHVEQEFDAAPVDLEEPWSQTSQSAKPIAAHQTNAIRTIKNLLNPAISALLTRTN